MPAASNVIDLDTHRKGKRPSSHSHDAQFALYAACVFVPMVWVPVWFGPNFEGARS